MGIVVIQLLGSVLKVLKWNKGYYGKWYSSLIAMGLVQTLQTYLFKGALLFFLFQKMVHGLENNLDFSPDNTTLLQM